MPRPHIEFIQSQALPWAASPWPFLAGCQAKVLSRDPATGAASALIKAPAGWDKPLPGWLEVDLELFVLDGALDVNGRRYGQDCYASLPAGYPVRGCRTDEGAVALAFLAREPAWREGAPPPGRHDLAATVEFLDAYEMAWGTTGLDAAHRLAGVRSKVLRGSPAEPSSTLLVASPPHLRPEGWRGPQMIHDCAEELYLLSGDCQTNVGPMAHGAYVWRPPGIAHGPQGSRGGNLSLIRTHGARLEHRWTVHEVPISRTPAYAPRLPAEFEAYRHRPWRPQRY